MFKLGTLTVIYILTIAAFNAIEFYDNWPWHSFLSGIACGLPIVFLWWKNSKIGVALFIIGVLALLLTVFGFLEGIERDHIFFTGTSLGFLFGFIPAFILNKPISYLKVSYLLKFDGYEKLSSKFEKKYQELTK